MLGVQNNCSSFPRSSLAPHNFDYGDPYAWYNYEWTVSQRLIRHFFNGWNELSPPTLSQIMIFLSCENPMNSSLYVDTTPCGLNYGSLNHSNSSLGSSNYNYVTLGGMNASDLMELCSIEKMLTLPKIDYGNISFKEIHGEPAYGFELSWFNDQCENCTEGCYLDSANRLQCIGK
ncbi:unnamed protein product [Dovyalis caffra]|uniref:Receptor kinase n=1 Tax=Dovyalis caffra TaxID=77055 RepID=A0AAV1RDC0_9ROSI|nr:unnamed protein product [Dovyalis caffra]